MATEKTKKIDEEEKRIREELKQKRDKIIEAIIEASILKATKGC